MARAGYDPNAAVSVWKKMLRAEQGGTPQFLSTHPSPKTSHPGSCKRSFPQCCRCISNQGNNRGIVIARLRCIHIFALAGAPALFLEVRRRPPLDAQGLPRAR